MHALLAPPAHLVEPDRGKRADQREARGQREEQRHHVVAEDQPPQHQAEDGVDDAEEDDIGAVGGEIVEPFGERLPQVAQPDAPDRRRRGLRLRRGGDGAPGRVDGVSRQPQLIDAPFDRISDRHGRFSRHVGSGVTEPSVANARRGRQSRESRDLPTTKYTPEGGGCRPR